MTKKVAIKGPVRGAPSAGAVNKSHKVGGSKEFGYGEWTSTLGGGCPTTGEYYIEVVGNAGSPC